MPDSVCASQKVEFFDNSSDKELINGYYWFFGDETGYYKEFPSHIYADTGFMDVRLRVYHNGCPSDTVKNNFIYIKGPVAKLQTYYECSAPFDVNFFMEQKGVDSFTWNFGDASPLETETDSLEHTYFSSGNYIAVLTACNADKSCSVESKKNIYIRNINADFAISDSVICVGDTILFDGFLSDDYSVFKNENAYATFLWNFGNQSQSFTLGTVKHIFQEKGNFNVLLTVKDVNGCADSFSKNIKVYKPQAIFSADDYIGCMPMTVNFSDLTVADTSIVNYNWYFGNSKTDSVQNPVHEYSDFGVYSVALSVTDIVGCSDSVYYYDFIEALRPVPDFTVSDQKICIGDSVKFTPLSKDIIASYNWDFGNGTISELKNPYCTFSDTGMFNVTLYLVDIQGCDSAKTVNAYINVQQPPVPDFKADTIAADCFPLIVNFADNSQGDYIGSWQWNFGDIISSTSQNQKPAHTYLKPGKYTVSLNTSTTNGCSASISKTDYIDVGGPYAEISCPDTVCKWQNAEFIMTNKQNVEISKWYFGDGYTAEGDTVFHAYKYSGNKNPVLLISSDNMHTCDKFYIDTVFVPDIFDLYMPDNSYSDCVPQTIFFSDFSSSAVNWNWTFSNGAVSSEQNPVIDFNAPGNYSAQLIASDYRACSDTVTHIFEIFQLPKITISNDTFICLGQQVNLFAEGAQNYVWSPQDFLNDANIFNPSAQPLFNINYVVTATDSNACVNYAETKIKVVQKPEILLHDTTIIIGETVILDAFAQDIEQYLWFHDYNISCTDCAETQLNPLETTVYTLTVTDTANCFEISKDIEISVSKRYTLDVPEAFSPNGDGVNDVVYVRGWGIMKLEYFRIYNRFGELVFEIDDKNIGWNGKYKGNHQTVESFTYVVKAITYEGQSISKTGNLKLLK